MTEVGLCEIALSGFEVFNDLVRLPLRRLTFLFGPNSAGKSAVEDALKILSEVCYTGEFTDQDWYARGAAIKSFDTGPDARRQRLEGAWHRKSGETDTYANSMRLGASFIIDEQQWSSLSKDVDFKDWNPTRAAKAAEGLHRLEVMVRFRREERAVEKSNGGGLGHVLRDVTFLLDGEPYLEFADAAELKINTQHPLLLGLLVPESFIRAEGLHPHRVLNIAGWLSVRGSVCVDDKKNLDIQHFLWNWQWQDDGFGKASEFLNAARGAIEGIER